jgi:hypothetical protein
MDTTTTTYVFTGCRRRRRRRCCYCRVAFWLVHMLTYISLSHSWTPFFFLVFGKFCNEHPPLPFCLGV